MSRTHDPKPHHPSNDVPDEFEPGELPVEPDEGPIPPLIPDDPEHERVREIDVAANKGRPAQPVRRQVEVARCP
jgi:hypothetical protein